MKSALPITVLPLLSAILQAATVNLVQISVDDATSDSIGAVSSNQWLESGSSYPTVTAPASYSTYRFTHWTNSSSPATPYRDAWGRSLNPISFTLLEATTCTAHYLPATRDTDGDGVPDWYEIEYFGDLTRVASFDGDGDGIQLSAEYSGGTHPLYGNSQQAGGVAYADSSLISFNRAGYASYTLRSVPAGTVNQTAIAPPGTVVTTPDLPANSAFGYWTLDGVRQVDAWGVAYPQITFTMGITNREAVAYLFSGDTDGDGVPDAYEQYYYGTLANNGTSDTDGDGIPLLAERNAGMNPLYRNAYQEGGVSWADSAMVTVNLADFSRYTLASDPPGMVNQSAIVPDGTVITTPNMTQSTFGYWTLDGVRQQDAWGVALRQIRFTMDGADRTAVAYLFADDSDGDGINDSYEQYHFGTLANGANSDTDGDGIPLLAEFSAGSSPLYGNAHQEGGVSWADSSLVVANLQPFERLSKMLIGGVLTNFFSPDPGVVTGIQAGTWSSTAVTDWDGDGDFDLFVAHEDGLRVFRNIGTVGNPNFEEISSGFSGLAALVSSINRPNVTGGDWNGDGLGDLVIGGNTGNLRLIASVGTFSSDGSGDDLTVASSSARPALGDMNGDGKADLIVLLDDGTARLYLNNGLPMPFAGPGTDNILSLAIPAGTSIATGDINQDGLPDILAADAEGRIWEFHANNDNTFTLKSKVWGGSYAGFATGLSLAGVDLDGDDDLDLIGGLANGGVLALLDPAVGRPPGLKALAGATSIQLDWIASRQSRIRGYWVYRASSSAGPWTGLLADPLPLPGYLDTALTTSAMNFYQVSGVSYSYLPGNSEPRQVESPPSDIASAAAGKITLALLPAYGKPGQKIGIKLAIQNSRGTSATGMQIHVNYDTSKLQPWSQAQPGEVSVLASGLSQNVTFDENGESASGQLEITGSAGSMEPGSGTMFTLQFKVADGLPSGTALGITISGATVFDVGGNALAVEISPQAQPASSDGFYNGDLDGDGFIANPDKILLQDLIKPNSRPPTTDELKAGDLNGDLLIDERDLVLLLQLLNQP